MKQKIGIKTIAVLVAPLLLFALLFAPYSWLNSAVIVEAFGCGCPQTTDTGEMIHPKFNANDFTLLFWLLVSACVTAMAVFLSAKKISDDKKWLRVVYVAGMLIASIFISYNFLQLMMWN